ncbi:MAG: hypothetical protein AB7F23_08325 [Phycisphaerae bacterium]|jgi:bifunctional UDP-N-acetylglucosamine pyrophosphorylase/glucosamine-1-phosphate N-acetyltransferase
MNIFCYAAAKAPECEPLTANKPAALLKALDKTVIEHNLLACIAAGEVKEIVVAVGFEAARVICSLGEEIGAVAVRYVETESSFADTLEECRAELTQSGRNVLAFECDCLLDAADMKSLVAEPESVLLDDSGEPRAIYSTLATAAAASMRAVPAHGLLPMKYPWHSLEANVELVRRLDKQQLLGQIEDNVTIKGNVYVAEGASVKSFSYIEGPAFIDSGSMVGPFAYVRKDTVIGKGVQIGRMELYDVVLMDGFTSKHNSYAAHSVIGENGNFGAGTITADYRHDGGNHKTLICGEKIDSGRRKLGAFLGDGVHTGIGTLIYPGRKLWPGTGTLPGEVIKKDVINS